jgi:hypothetical protein
MIQPTGRVRYCEPHPTRASIGEQFMRHKYVITLLFISFIVLAGCAAPFSLSLKQHDTYQPPSDGSKGYIYIYREKEFMASGRGIYISANGKRIGGLNNGTYFVYAADLGTIEIAAENSLDKADTVKRKIMVEAMRKYYIRGSFKSGFWDIKPHVEIIHESEGAQAIESLSYETLN